MSEDRSQEEPSIVTEVSLERRVGADVTPQRPELPLRYAGYRIFLVVALLTAAFFAAFVIIGLITFPYPASIAPMLEGSSAGERVDAYVTLRSAWLAQTMTTGQTLVFGSMIPLLGSIVGYVLGARHAQADTESI